jgi:RNA polymerase sigma-70 factor, ECF subfamily
VTEPPSELSRLAQVPDDPKAWEALFRRYWPYVFAINYRLLRGNRDLAEDASQDVFLRIARYRPFADLRDPAAFKAYLRIVARNVCRDYLRWSRREESGEQRLEDQSDLFGADGNATAVQEVDEILKDLTRDLSDVEQRLVRMLIDGYGLGDIAQSLGLTYSAAGVRVHRLRNKLRNRLSLKK